MGSAPPHPNSVRTSPCAVSAAPPSRTTTGIHMYPCPPARFYRSRNQPSAGIAREDPANIPCTAIFQAVDETAAQSLDALPTGVHRC